MGSGLTGLAVRSNRPSGSSATLGMFVDVFALGRPVQMGGPAWYGSCSMGLARVAHLGPNFKKKSRKI